MVRELLESVELQEVSRVFTLESDHCSERAKLVFGELLIPDLIGAGEGCLQLTKATTTMAGTVFDRPDTGVAPTLAMEFFVRRTSFYKEVAEVLAAISQGSPPVVT
ncbi:hypothetical protein [Frankia sp. Cas4]|uniref:hypothetical protein n=1 Tax=Frankia sp. Cas4 TaxID=3073927 RepID=UPI002AD3150E|nr:hypothetical protein [Frankia sp. Cas4]